MNKHEQLRLDVLDEDKLVQHDLRVMTAIREESDRGPIALTLEDAYGELAGRYSPAGPVDPKSLIGNVYRVWGYAIDHEDPAAGIDVNFLEPPEDPDPSLPLVPMSVCADAAIPALHTMIDLLDAMTNRPIARYVHRVLGCPDVYPLFFRAKAAPHSHHAFDGGLAAHSAECASIIGDMSTSHFSGRLGRDLAIASAMLHDLGKIAWAGSDYVNPMLLHESRGLVLAADALRQLRKETDSGTAEMAAYLLSKESRTENAACPEAVAVTLADRLSATRNGQKLAFGRSKSQTLTAGRLNGAYGKRYVRVVDTEVATIESSGAS